MVLAAKARWGNLSQSTPGMTRKLFVSRLPCTKRLLAYEALWCPQTILALLGPDPCFPAVFDLIEHNDDLYLAMEEIVGDTLEEYARRLFTKGTLQTEQVIAWGRELAAIIAKIHAKGLVYRDLKPANIM